MFELREALQEVHAEDSFFRLSEIHAWACCDDVGWLADAPFEEVAQGVGGWWLGADRVRDFGDLQWAPDEGVAVGGYVDGFSEVGVAAVDLGEVAVGGAFQGLLARFPVGPVGDAVEEPTDMACVPDVHFVLPDVVEFGIKMGEELGCLVDLGWDTVGTSA